MRPLGRQIDKEELIGILKSNPISHGWSIFIDRRFPDYWQMAVIGNKGEIKMDYPIFYWRRRLMDDKMIDKLATDILGKYKRFIDKD